MALAIGALVGGAIGGTLAVSFTTATFLTGWAIGSLIGQLLLAPSNNQTVSGPRLENTAPSVSNIIGSPIQIPYGTVRMPASVIWSNSITEVVNKDKQSSGGSIGGGSSTTTITYEYFLDFAVAVSEGPIVGIKKIWANNKVIYDQDGSVKSEPWLKFQVYTGTETQVPDWLMERKIGVGKVPAYRGLAYVVFNQFALEEFGNRAPGQIEFEVVGTGTTGGVTSVIADAGERISTAGSTAFTVSGYIDDLDDDKIITSWHSTTEGWAAIINRSAPTVGVEILETPKAVLNYGNQDSQAIEGKQASNSFIGINKEGYLVSYFTAATGTYASPSNDTCVGIYELNGDIGLVRKLGIHDVGSFIFFNPHGFLLDSYFLEYSTEAAYDHWRWGACGVYDNTDTKFIDDTSTNYPFKGTVANYPVYYNSTYGHVPGSHILDAGGDSIYGTFISEKDDAGLHDVDKLVYRYNEYSFGPGDYASAYSSFTNVLYLEPYIYLRASDISGVVCGQDFGTITDICSDMLYAREDATGTWLILRAATSTLASTILVCHTPFNQDTPTRWYSTFAQGWPSGSHSQPNRGSRMDTGIYDPSINTWYADSGSGVYVSFNFISLTFDFHTVSPNTRYTSNPGLMYLNNEKFIQSGSSDINHINTFYAQIQHVDFNAVNSQSTNLGIIIDDICDRVSFDAADLNTTDCYPITVEGYTIRDRSPARESIEEVTMPYFVDPVVSDWILKFVPRGSDVETIIPYNDLGCVEGTNYEDPYSLVFPEENNLPKEVDFRYLGRSNNYQVAHQRAARSSLATNSEDKKTINTQVVLSDVYAKEAANKFLTNAWTNAKRLSIKVSKKYSYLEPTDIIQIYTKTGILITARILEIMNNFNTMEINAEVELYEDYISPDYSEYSAGYDSSDAQKIPLIGTMLVSPIDSLPIFDIFVEPNSGAIDSFVYMGGSSFFDSWPGGLVYSSTDKVNYSYGDPLTTPCYLGNAMDSSDLRQEVNWKLLDQESYITVDFSLDPELVSVTREEILKGGVNVLHINNSAGGEIVAAMTVSADGNRYTFSNLLRGRYHSYVNMGNHTYPIGSAKVTLITADTILPSRMPYGIYDATYYYKGVTIGADISKVVEKSSTFRGTWNDSAPSTELLIEESGSDLVFSWVPCSNYGPLNTLWTPEIKVSKYRVGIYDTDGTLVRQIDDITTNEYTYLAADMTTDSVDLTDTLEFRVTRYSSMKEYDTYYSSKFRRPGTTASNIEAVAPNVQLHYDMSYLSGTDTIVDEIGTTGSNLVLTGGSIQDVDLYPSILTYKRPGGNLRFDTPGTRFATSGTTAGSSRFAFSFMIIGKVLSNGLFGSSSDTWSILERSDTTGWDTHSYKLNVSATGDVSFTGDITASSTIAGLGETFHVIVAVDPGSGTQHSESLYVNGVLVDSDITVTFVSNWGDEFLFADTNSEINSGTKYNLDLLTYWNRTLTATEVANLYTYYLGAKK